MLNRLKRHVTQACTHWELSVHHPSLDEDDTDPLPERFGEKAVLPPEFQLPVTPAFISELRDATSERHAGTLEWFNCRLPPSARLDCFGNFIDSCSPNETVWVYVRFHDVVFSLLHTAFVETVEYLNSLPERFVSPLADALPSLWTMLGYMCQLVEFMPRLAATGWRQREIENVLIVLLDHGNNPELRMLGMYTLVVYMTALAGNYSQMTRDLFSNAISIRALSFTDMPDASRVVGDIMCIIARGVCVADIGCGQRAIVGFKAGRTSICPVLQDIAYPISPQGILAMRMMRCVVALINYFSGVVPSPLAVFTDLYNSGLLSAHSSGGSSAFGISDHIHSTKKSAPLMAMQSEELKSALTSVYRMFHKDYMKWIYGRSNVTLERRSARHQSVLSLRLMIGAMLDTLVPRCAHMLSEEGPHMPNFAETLVGNVQQDSSHSPDLGKIPTAALHTTTIQAFPTLRHMLLDTDPASRLVFTDVLCHSLGAPQRLASEELGADSLDKDELMEAGYDACVGALTIIRLWMVCKEEYRPVHLKTTGASQDTLAESIVVYIEHVHKLTKWLIDMNCWDIKKLTLLYNGLLIHNVVMRMYRRYLPQQTTLAIMDHLQDNVLLILSKPLPSESERTDPKSFPNRALSLLTKCVIAGWLFQGNPLPEVTERLSAIYQVPTVWTSHLAVWSNVLRALTAARGRHILMVNERVLVQECMFAGQRQRRGMNKVDEYLTKLKDPAFYLNSSIDDEGLESVTPFYITSSMVWDTVRRVFAAAKAAALTEIAFVKACSEQSQSTESKLADPSSDYQSKTLLLRTKSIYARIFLSGPRNLLRATDVELASSLDAPTRRTRGLPGRRPEYTHLTARPRTGPARRPREPNHTAEWATQFSSVAGHPPGPNDAGPNDAGPNDAPADPHPLTQIGPAHLVVEKTTRKQAQRTGRQQSRGSSKKTNLALQGADVAAMNSSGAISLLDNFGTRVWQSEAVWNDFHISQFVEGREHPVRDLQNMWRIWADLLGSPLNANDAQSKAILRGIIKSWDVYRAALDCSRCAPDDDYVIFKTSWWVSEMASRFGMDDYRGRVSQAAIFRMGCRFSERINRRILFLRSRFLQAALIVLSPLARGDPVNIDPIQMFLVECRLLLSFGISGSRVLLLALERELRRIFLEQQSYQGSFTDPAIEGAATLLVSMSTMLSNGRVLSVRGSPSKALGFSESNMVSKPEDAQLVRIVGYAEQDRYPIFSSNQQSPKLDVAWENGGPMFGRLCDLMWRVALELDRSDTYSYECRGRVENTILSGVAMVCLAELCIPDKSAQNERLVDNCLAAITSRLFAARYDVVSMAVSSLGAFVIGHNEIVPLLGMTRASRLIMFTMYAVVEHLDRAAGEITAELVGVLQGMLRLLADLLVKAPQVITQRSSSASGLRIRDFLVEHVIKRCTHPLAPTESIAHEYNRTLTCSESQHGVRLCLAAAATTPHAESSLRDVVQPADDEQNATAANAKLVRLMAETLYMSLIMRFDESTHLAGSGSWTRPSAESCAVYKSDRTSPSESIAIYSHGCGLLQVCRGVNEGSYRCIAIHCAGMHTFYGHTAPWGPAGYCGSHEADGVSHAFAAPVVRDGDVIDESNRQAAIPVVSSLTLKDVPDHRLAANTSLGVAAAPHPESEHAYSDQDVPSAEIARLQEKIDAFAAEEAKALADSGDADAADARACDVSATPEPNASWRAGLHTARDTVRMAKHRAQRANTFHTRAMYSIGFDLFEDAINYMVPLQVTESLEREIRSLGRIHARETVKLALFYVGPGQWSEAEILSNTRADTSLSYRNFVQSLGWPVSLATFGGYTGKLERDGSDGSTCPYFSDDGIEIAFHEVTSMPTNADDPRQLKKKRHIGNDHVHIVWNESNHNYRPETISGDFGNVQIQINPLEPGEFGIGIYYEDHVKPFGPLTSGMVVSADALPDAVRATAINGHRRVMQTLVKSYTPPFAIRQEMIDRIVERHSTSE